MPKAMLFLVALLSLIFGGMVAQAQTAPHADGYVGSERCTDCHEAEAAAWAASHHAGAWTEVADDTVRADFDGTTFSLGEMHVAFELGEDGARQARVTELDGETTTYRVHSVVGVEPLQQYLFETEPGRLQSFDVVWDTEQGRWFHLYPDQNPPPNDALHWSGPYKNWNARCAACHATGYSATYQPTSDTYESTWSEIGVGCESCHGPGQAHLDWADDLPEGWGAAETAGMPPLGGFAVDLTAEDALIDTCGGCHSRREAYHDGTPPPGSDYHDAYRLSLLRSGLYWPDGQIRDEVYVMGSFLQSKMHDKGVTCADCHDLHSGQILAEDNSLCTQCHSPAGNPAFPTLPLQVFDSPEHHHHPEGSSGAECRSCHMPEQVYMGNDARADHSFRIPRPDLSPVTGAPDACTSCHTGQTPAWAAETLENWFPDSAHRSAHPGQVFARAEADPRAAQGDLMALAHDVALPGITRATALWLAAQDGGAEVADRVAPLLNDPDPMIRAAAVDAQRAAEDQTKVLRLVERLDDPSRSVRMAAARGLLGAPVARLPQAVANRLRVAQGEMQASYGARLDFPETHLQLGGLALTMRNFQAADQAFARATDLDPQLVDAWIMQVRINDALNGAEATRARLVAALEANPSHLGLLNMLAEIDGTAPDLLPPQLPPE